MSDPLRSGRYDPYAQAYDPYGHKQDTKSFNKYP
jgi:hypothetical protein